MPNRLGKGLVSLSPQPGAAARFMTLHAGVKHRDASNLKQPLYIREAQPGSMPRNLRGFMLLPALVLSFACHAAEDSPVRSIKVTYDGETYVCDAVMFAPVQSAVAWEVLTDFEHMAEWVPNVRESRVVKRETNAVTIEQRGVAKFGVASLPYTSERRLEMNKPVTIRSAQVRGTLLRVESLMTLEPDGNGTSITYHFEMVPGLLAGFVMSKSVLEHEITEQFGAIVGEMSRRAR
jgi:carbon monoxide dehydrogenase subunit G